MAENSKQKSVSSNNDRKQLINTKTYHEKIIPLFLNYLKFDFVQHGTQKSR
jgi:hypothetical protein